jgi:predicted nucleotidyltransferase
LNGERILGAIEERKQFTVAKVSQFREALRESDALAESKACVYATGSYGRCEASNHSDLDVFIVAKNKNEAQGEKVSMLNRLDEICIKADLIKMSKHFDLPPFSGEGHYLVHYTVNDFTKSLGKPEDDFTNTFTARLLLLLESCALIGKPIYREIAQEVIAAYWRDYEPHSEDFMPAFLANDILRLWRTFCVNYEAFTNTSPAEQKVKRKIQNYKLKHSRLMTCYSAILYLLYIYRKNETVSPLDAMRMFETAPTHRIQEMAVDRFLADSSITLNDLLQQYEKFLTETNVPKKELERQFEDPEQSKILMAASRDFGDLMFQALNKIGHGSLFHRMLVV